MTRYMHNRKQMLRERAMLGVAARQRKRAADEAAMVDCGGLTTDGCLGRHSVRLLAWPGDVRRVAVVVDGQHRRPRTMRGVQRCIAAMVNKEASRQ